MLVDHVGDLSSSKKPIVFFFELTFVVWILSWSLGMDSLVLEVFADVWKAAAGFAAIAETKRISSGVETGTCEKELVLAPKYVWFILSTCTWVVLKKKAIQKQRGLKN